MVALSVPELDESAELVTERFTLDSSVQKSLVELFTVSTQKRKVFYFIEHAFCHLTMYTYLLLCDEIEGVVSYHCLYQSNCIPSVRLQHLSKNT